MKIKLKRRRDFSNMLEFIVWTRKKVSGSDIAPIFRWLENDYISEAGRVPYNEPFDGDSVVFLPDAVAARVRAIIAGNKTDSADIKRLGRKSIRLIAELSIRCGIFTSEEELVRRYEESL